MNEKSSLDKILRELAKDQEPSLEELFNRYYPRLFDFSKSFLKLEQGIDDIIQEVFIRIWQNRKNIKDPTTFNSYIFTITRNLLLNELRSRLNHKNLKDEVRKLSMAQEYAGFDHVQYKDLRNRVSELIEELPQRQKEIFVLSRTEGFSHKEIAGKLQISTKTVEYHISLAIKHIKQKIYI
jgi:RNA polymerase sigma-70 factor (ECF subfamily)